MGRDGDLRELLQQLNPKARDDLRRVLIRDFHVRNATSTILMRYRDQNGQDWADNHRLPDDASGGAAEGGAIARRDRRRVSIAASIRAHENQV